MDHNLLMYPTEPSSDVPSKLVIMGGRDLQQYFEDLHVLELSEDISKIHWNESEVGRPPHVGTVVCNSCCDAIESVPYHKVFTFGGKTGPMACVNKIAVLDTGAREWERAPRDCTPHCRARERAAGTTRGHRLDLRSEALRDYAVWRVVQQVAWGHMAAACRCGHRPAVCMHRHLAQHRPGVRVHGG